MDSAVVFNEVIILFLIMVVGFAAKKFNIINDETRRKLSEMLIYITMPCLIIISFNFEFSKEMLYNACIVLIFAAGIHIFSILLGMLIYNRYPYDVKKVLKFITVYTNCGFMGLPVLEGLFGKQGVFYGSIYNAVFNISVWTNGIMIFTGNKASGTLKRALINPGIIAVIMGMAIFLFSAELPYPLFKALEMVGSMTTPVSMIIIGSFLADSDFKKIFSGFDVYYGSAVRLVLIPVVTLVVLKIIGLREDLLGPCVTLVAMPAAANTVIFAEMYGGDTELASRCIAISTLLSVITIPLVVMFT